MMIEQFIDRLEQQGLLDQGDVDDLRRRIARIKGKKITPEAIAKYLVDKGRLTRFQATKLVNDVTNLLDAGPVSETASLRTLCFSPSAFLTDTIGCDILAEKLLSASGNGVNVQPKQLGNLGVATMTKFISL